MQEIGSRLHAELRSAWRYRWPALGVAWAVLELRRRRSGVPNPVPVLLRRRAGALQLVNGGLLLALWAIRLATHAVPAPFA